MTQDNNLIDRAAIYSKRPLGAREKLSAEDNIRSVRPQEPHLHQGSPAQGSTTDNHEDLYLQGLVVP